MRCNRSRYSVSCNNCINAFSVNGCNSYELKERIQDDINQVCEGIKLLSEGAENIVNGCTNIGIRKCCEGCCKEQEATRFLIEDLKMVCYTNCEQRDLIQNGIRNLECGIIRVYEGINDVCNCRECVGICKINEGIRMEEEGIDCIVRGLNRVPFSNCCR